MKKFLICLLLAFGLFRVEARDYFFMVDTNGTVLNPLYLQPGGTTNSQPNIFLNPGTLLYFSNALYALGGVGTNTITLTQVTNIAQQLDLLVSSNGNNNLLTASNALYGLIVGGGGSSTNGLATVAYVLTASNNLYTLSVNYALGASNSLWSALLSSTNFANLSPIITNLYAGRTEMQAFAESLTNGFASTTYVLSVGTTISNGVITQIIAASNNLYGVTVASTNLGTLSGMLTNLYAGRTEMQAFAESLTNGFVTATITNNLATISYVLTASNNVYTLSQTYTLGASNALYSLVVSSTNLANLSPIFTNLYAGRTEMQVYVQSLTNGFVQSSVTNGLVTFNYVTSVFSSTNATFNTFTNTGAWFQIAVTTNGNYSAGGTNSLVFETASTNTFGNFPYTLGSGAPGGQFITWLNEGTATMNLQSGVSNSIGNSGTVTNFPLYSGVCITFYNAPGTTNWSIFTAVTNGLATTAFVQTYALNTSNGVVTLIMTASNNLYSVTVSSTNPATLAGILTNAYFIGQGQLLAESNALYSVTVSSTNGATLASILTNSFFIGLGQVNGLLNSASNGAITVSEAYALAATNTLAGNVATAITSATNTLAGSFPIVTGSGVTSNVVAGVINFAVSGGSGGGVWPAFDTTQFYTNLSSVVAILSGALTTNLSANTFTNLGGDYERIISTNGNYTFANSGDGLVELASTNSTLVFPYILGAGSVGQIIKVANFGTALANCVVGVSNSIGNGVTSTNLLIASGQSYIFQALPGTTNWAVMSGEVTNLVALAVANLSTTNVIQASGGLTTAQGETNAFLQSATAYTGTLSISNQNWIRVPFYAMVSSPGGITFLGTAASGAVGGAATTVSAGTSLHRPYVSYVAASLSLTNSYNSFANGDVIWHTNTSYTNLTFAEFQVAFPSTNANVQERVGWTHSISSLWLLGSISTDDGVWFFCDTNAANWQFVNSNGTTTTNVDTGIALSTNCTRFGILLDEGAQATYGLINGKVVATNTSNFARSSPVITFYPSFGQQATNNANATEVDFYFYGGYRNAN